MDEIDKEQFLNSLEEVFHAKFGALLTKCDTINTMLDSIQVKMSSDYDRNRLYMHCSYNKEKEVKKEKTIEPIVYSFK